MPPTAEEMRRNLAEFAARWGGYSGSERSEAQPFLGELFQCFGLDRREAGARFEDVGRLAAAIIERRQAICAEREIGLTTLYNEVDEGAYADLRHLHEQLDRAVTAAYGWPGSAAADPDESNRRLLELNGQIARGEIEYQPFDFS